MASPDDYVAHPEQVLIDAAHDPIFQSFMEETDFELITVTLGGVQSQVQALSRRSIRKVVEKALARCHERKVEVKQWICSPLPEGFDLCGRLNTPPGKLMRELDAFLNKKWTVRGMALVDVFTMAAATNVGVFLGILGGLICLNRELVNLCDCPK